jgi:hypothetical protein
MSAAVAINMLDRVIDLLTKEHAASERELARIKQQIGQLTQTASTVDENRVREVENKIDDLAGMGAEMPTLEQFTQQLQLPPDELFEFLKHQPRRIISEIPFDGQRAGCRSC